MTGGGEASREVAEEARRMEAVGRLAAGIVHDFNNVLAAIRGYGQIALRSLDDLLGAASGGSAETISADRTAIARLRADVAAIEDATLRAAALTRQLSALTRPAGTEAATLDLGVVASSIHDLASRLLPKTLALTMVPATAPVAALANEAALMQAALELLLDLRDVLGGEGAIEIAAAHVGPGDARAALRFSHSTASGGSTGAPGARARRLAAELLARTGGELRVEGPDSGSAIVLSLPAPSPPHGSPSVEKPSDGASVGATVLLVEDDPSVRRIARMVLERLGYRVVPAGDGHEALRMVEMLASDDVVPDLLVTDVTMPVMNGPELAAELRRRAPGIGVLFMSGMGEPATAGPTSADARDDFLEKPFTLDDLAARVAGLLRRTVNRTDG